MNIIPELVFQEAWLKRLEAMPKESKEDDDIFWLQMAFDGKKSVFRIKELNEMFVYMNEQKLDDAIREAMINADHLIAREKQD